MAAGRVGLGLGRVAIHKSSAASRVGLTRIKSGLLPVAGRPRLFLAGFRIQYTISFIRVAEMVAAKPADSRIYLPLFRCLGRRLIQDHYGIKPSTFSRWVAKGIMPKAIKGTRVWDRVAIDLALNKLSGVGLIAANDNETEADRWFREEDNASAA